MKMHMDLAKNFAGLQIQLDDLCSVWKMYCMAEWDIKPHTNKNITSYILHTKDV